MAPKPDPDSNPNPNPNPNPNRNPNRNPNPIPSPEPTQAHDTLRLLTTYPATALLSHYVQSLLFAVQSLLLSGGMPEAPSWQDHSRTSLAARGWLSSFLAGYALGRRS